MSGPRIHRRPEPCRLSGYFNIGGAIHGFGHGLSDAARQAIDLIRVNPATHSGAPIDEAASGTISFLLAERPSEIVV